MQRDERAREMKHLASPQRIRGNLTPQSVDLGLDSYARKYSFCPLNHITPFGGLISHIFAVLEEARPATHWIIPKDPSIPHYLSIPLPSLAPLLQLWLLKASRGLVHLLLLINAELAWSTVDQEQETADNREDLEEVVLGKVLVGMVLVKLQKYCQYAVAGTRAMSGRGNLQSRSCSPRR